MNHVLHTPLHSGDNNMLVLLLKNAMEENRKKYLEISQIKKI
jgi:hypothetical protein